MISVPIDSIDAIVSGMPPTKPNPSDTVTINLSAPTWAIKVIYVLIGLVVTGGLYIINYAQQEVSNGFKNATAEVGRVQTTLDKALTLVESVKTTVQKQEVSIAVLETRILNFERPRYESKAKAMGFKNPQIVAASFQTNQTFESKTATSKGDYYIKYTIVSYDAPHKTLSLKIDAILPNDIMLRNNEIIFANVSPGQVVNVSVSPQMPRILLQILDLPTPTSAILAIGEKQDSFDKAS